MSTIASSPSGLMPTCTACRVQVARTRVCGVGVIAVPPVLRKTPGTSVCFLLRDFGDVGNCAEGEHHSCSIR